MSELALQIDETLREILLVSENNLEVLIGSCQSEVKLTNTQEHILMLLSKAPLTNSELAKRLHVSQAAVTKAVKSLVKEGMLAQVRGEVDARLVYHQLTDLAAPIAAEHQHHHAHTLASYDEMLRKYSDEEQAVIASFLTDLVERIGEK